MGRTLCAPLFVSISTFHFFSLYRQKEEKITMHYELLQVSLRIERVPPGGVTLEIFLKPR